MTGAPATCLLADVQIPLLPIPIQTVWSRCLPSRRPTAELCRHSRCTTTPIRVSSPIHGPFELGNTRRQRVLSSPPSTPPRNVSGLELLRKSIPLAAPQSASETARDQLFSKHLSPIERAISIFSKNQKNSRSIWSPPPEAHVSSAKTDRRRFRTVFVRDRM